MMSLANKLSRPAPMSNTMRSRLFRSRHPGYDAGRKRAERAALRRDRAARNAAMRAAMAADQGNSPLSRTASTTLPIASE
jgi:hypothetical protein